MASGPGLSRRALLGSGAVAGAGALVLGGGVLAREARGDATGRRAFPFLGPHQSGVTTPVTEFGLLAALDVVGDRAALERALRALTAEAGGLVEGRTPEARDPAFPPAETGVLGPDADPAGLTVTLSVGASVFDDRFGLADRRPRELAPMPFLANDRLDPARTHGDLLLTLAADRPDVLLHALRQLLRATRGELALHWMVDGYNRPDTRPVPGRTDNRNLLGFKDGTANLDAGDQALMHRLVWVAEDAGEPAWAVGGSYQAVRVIRMLVEKWDRTPLGEQEAVIGRHKGSGAPLGGRREEETPAFADDPEGDRTPLDAHIRLANPRTPQSEGSRILRRGFNYSRGYDAAGQLDQGLAFVSYQASLARGFLAVQDRLAGEPLEEYIRPEGGGFFFVLPGITTPDDWLGRPLLGD